MRILIAALLGALLATAAEAEPPGVINQYNALCSATFPRQCVVINADGSLLIQPAPGVAGDVNLTGINGGPPATGLGPANAYTLRMAPVDEALTPLNVPGTPSTYMAGMQGAPGMVPLDVTVKASTTAGGGCTLGTLATTASTNATAVAGTPKTLCWLNALNTTTTLYWLLLYDKASAPTCNSDAIKQYIPIGPASAAGGLGGIVPGFGPYAADFPTGVAFCVTAAAAGTGNAVTGLYINYGTK